MWPISQCKWYVSKHHKIAYLIQIKQIKTPINHMNSFFFNILIISKIVRQINLNMTCFKLLPPKVHNTAIDFWNNLLKLLEHRHSFLALIHLQLSFQKKKLKWDCWTAPWATVPPVHKRWITTHSGKISTSTWHILLKHGEGKDIEGLITLT